MVLTTNNTAPKILHKLSIQVSLSGLSFCTQNKDGEIVAYHHDNFGIQLSPDQLLEKVEKELDQNPDLAFDFEAVEVIHQNELYTLVPSPLFDETQAKDYLQYSIKLLETDFVAVDTLEQMEVNCVYVPYTNINNFFFERFGSFTYHHAQSVFLKHIGSYHKNTVEKTIYANLHEKSVDLVAMERNKLLLANSFTCETTEDFIYYLLFTAEQLQFNPEEFTLTLLGNIEKDDPYYAIAYTYIRNVSLGGLLPAPTILAPASDFVQHKYFTLLS
ncbi:DUF3822 family protein [Aquimarina brevivitae]|uniref:Uncharacterized protein DUF3822 n=1 Tax=Aquimarina brevivitae TaxID=323412 RepID=A0A4Q7NUW0_9FLAO|nr:DUF3822 family protein [Aquimarina brevivitae]RZS90730.1 uncharacterized protein DUF3822 [Aquimarina brevivitae]